jgi:phosphate transport system substrate-binding protein
MKFKPAAIAYLFLALFALGSCAGNSHQPTVNPARFTSDSAAIAVDESLQPVVDQELYIFESLNKKTHPRVIYAPENNAINLLLADSVRVAITARNLTTDEYRTLADHNLRPVVGRFAVDAVAIIVNKASTDTTLTLSALKNMLNGGDSRGKNIIFDNPNSSLVSYLKEFSGSKDLKGKNIFSLKSNAEVIHYVGSHPNAIGIIDFSWLDDPDKSYAAAADSVQVISVRNDIGFQPPRDAGDPSAASKPEKVLTEGYFMPSQDAIGHKQYALTRNLYIINCTGNTSMGKRFADLLEGERGQLIVLHAGLMPDVFPELQINIVK